MKFDLFSTRIATEWGSVDATKRSEYYCMLFLKTMQRIRAFLTEQGEYEASKYLREHVHAMWILYKGGNAIVKKTGGSVELYLEQLFRWRPLVADGGGPGRNPLPDAYDRHPALRYMVGNLRCVTPLTSDVMWALQTTADGFDPLIMSQPYLPDDVGDDEEDGRRYYAASGSPRDIANAAEEAGFAGDMVELLDDIDEESVCAETDLPQGFYRVLAEMKREARDAKQRQAAAAPYLCRRLFEPVARLRV